VAAARISHEMTDGAWLYVARASDANPAQIAHCSPVKRARKCAFRISIAFLGSAPPKMREQCEL